MAESISLMEVDMASVVRRAEDRYVTDIRTRLREEKIRYEGVRRIPDGGIEVQLRDAEPERLGAEDDQAATARPASGTSQS